MDGVAAIVQEPNGNFIFADAGSGGPVAADSFYRETSADGVILDESPADCGVTTPDSTALPIEEWTPRELAPGRAGRVRRGDPGADGILDQARDLAMGTQELQRIAPVAAARGESAWWARRPEQLLAELSAPFASALAARDPWIVGELGFWMWRAGALTTPPKAMADPYAQQIAGDWRGAAKRWEQIGCPYEYALALSDGDEGAQRSALEVLERLGAGPAAETLRQKLHAAGLRGVPRGPRPSTKENPRGLTVRELEVLPLLARGLSNANIAARLFISAKTVDHHISNILAKLNAHTRTEAVAQARERGILKQPK